MTLSSTNNQSTLELAKKGIFVLFALYVAQNILIETAKGHAGKESRDQGSHGSGGKFHFTRKEDKCTLHDTNPIGPPEDHCSVDAFTFEEQTFVGGSTGDKIETFVVLPNNYDRNRAKPYPVLYSLHPAEKESSNGLRSFFQLMRWRLDASMCTMLQLTTNEEYVVVYPSGGDKCYVNSKDGKTSMAEDNVVKDLVPWVQQNYNVAKHDNTCFGMSMGAYGCILFGLKYPDVFPNIVVESPGQYPRFVPWDELIASEGPKETPFSSRDFLMEYIFDEKSYDSYDLCTVAGKTPKSTSKNSHFTIYHGDQDPYAEQVDNIIGCLEKNKVPTNKYLVHGCGHGDLPLCIGDKPENTCLVKSLQDGIAAQA
jgi:S-formylglutathione hydrolase FrmB